MYATIRPEPLAFDVASSPAPGLLCVPLHKPPEDDVLMTLETRITEHVSCPWVWDEDDDAGRHALYQIGPPDPWMLALGALVWEGLVQGATWDAVKVAATRALDKLRAVNAAPPSHELSSKTTSAWRNRLSVELGVSKTSVDEELIGRLFVGLRVCLESDRSDSAKQVSQPKAPSPHSSDPRETS